MKTRMLFFCLMLPFIVWAQRTWVEDPHVTLRESPGHFSKVHVSGGVTVYLSAGPQEKIAVGGSSEQVAAQIRTELKGETLMISAHPEGGWNRKARKANVYIAFTELEKITGDGAVQIHLEGRPVIPGLQISLSGASDLRGSLETERLSVQLSGASDISLSGKATNCSVSLSGASDFKAFDLETIKSDIKASGASDARIQVTKELEARASGASSIHYRGDAVLKTVDISGSSDVTKKSD